MAERPVAGGWLVVSLHDVTPRYRAALEHIVHALETSGVTTFSCLVTPLFHGEHSIAADAEFAAWLRELSARNIEMALHGLTHCSARRSLQSWLTQGSNEFGDLDCSAAAQKIRQAQALFDQAGLKTSGFTAPAWQTSAGTFSALRAAGMAYCTTMFAIHALQSATSVRSEAISYCASGPGRVYLRCQNAWLEHACLPHRRVVRVAIHPQDLGHKAFGRALRLIETLLRTRVPVSYARYMECHHGIA